MTCEIVWRSPVLSQSISEGPEIVILQGAAKIRFRAEDDEKWHEIHFYDVIKFLFTEFASCSKDHVDAYDVIVNYGINSAFAKEVLRGSRRDVSCFKHYRIFFDDIGSCDVFANSVSAS